MPVTLTRLPIAQQYAIRALIDSGKSIRQAAQLSGVSYMTAFTIKHAKTLDMEAVDKIKNGLAGKFYDVADRSLNHISNKKLKHSSAAQLIMVSAVSTDKARLIEGKATQRTEYIDATDKAIHEEISRTEAELAALGGTGDIIPTEANDLPPIPDREHAPSTVEGA